MTYTDIYVKDTYAGKVHKVGDYRYDSLFVVDGIVYYRDIRDGHGSKDGTYEFISSDNGEIVWP
jgi:hypothetical protein